MANSSTAQAAGSVLGQGKSPVPTAPNSFDGTDVLRLSGILTSADILFRSDREYWTDGRRVAYLASSFSGAAGVWLGTVSEPDLSTWAGFRALVVQQFGLDGESAKRFALRRMAAHPYTGKGAEDLLAWLGEFNSWMTAAGIPDSATRSILILSNLPEFIRRQLLPNISDIADLTDVLKELREGVAGGIFSSGTTKGSGGQQTRPRCGRCKKRGHTAKDCRSSNPKN